MNTEIVVQKEKNPGRFAVLRHKAAAGLVTAGAVFGLASNSFAADTITDLFTSVNISGVQTAVYTVLAALVAIGLLFFGRALLRKLGVSV
jgi:Fe2+ transport system protein B